MLAIHLALKLSLALAVFALGSAIVLIGIVCIGLSYWVSE